MRPEDRELNAAMNDSIATALNALYAAFADVPKPKKIDACWCCLSDEEIATMLSKPLRKLSGSELSSYSESAFLTVGSVEDYLYFLPRILEVGCVEKFAFPPMEITGRAIGKCEPSRWKRRRRLALEEFLSAVVQWEIDRGDASFVDALVCAIAGMEIDLAPFVARLESSTPALLSFYEQNADSIPSGELTNAFWEKDSPGF